MGSTLEFRKGFVLRLKQSCDESKLIPPPHKGRQQVIAERLGVAPEAVSKWFKAVSMPRPDKMERLAELLQVDQSWLAFGISPEMDRAERKAHSRQVDGAVMLVMGLITLAGAHVGFPSPKDMRAGYVDFYLTWRGSVYPAHVSLAVEKSKNTYEVLLPKEYADVRCITVLPKGNHKYHLLYMPMNLIEEHKTRRSGMVSISMGYVDGKYMTGSDVWPRMSNFTEMI